MSFPTVNPALARALAAQGYSEPTPVQAAVMEEGTSGRDLLVSAQTGSGKTVAYGMAFAETLLGDAEQFGWAAAPLALIIAPTRELALQVSRELGWLYGETRARVVTCVGGMDARREQKALAAGAHIVVGTPGRLVDHLNRGNLDLSGLKVAVLDEADEMLDLGFREDLEILLDAAPEGRRTLLFSATIARDIAALAQRYQDDAQRIDTTQRNVPHGDIDYRVIHVGSGDTDKALVNVLRFHDAASALVFCATREGVRRLNGVLRERGFATVALSGELSQKERSDALEALRHGHARVCVATDVAARGLDLPNLDLVVHAELPVNTATLLHRSGRTGRAGRKGTSVLLTLNSRRRRAEQLLSAAHIDATWAAVPTAAEIRAGDQLRLQEDAIFKDEAGDDDMPLARKLLENRSAEDIALALIRLYRSRLPEPEEMDTAPAGAWQRPAARPERGDRPERAERGPRPEAGARPDHGAFADAVWFRLSIGRERNADPKWVLPMICGVGGVTRSEIGQIRVFDRETKFQVAASAAEAFEASARANPDDRGDIERTSAPSERPAFDKPRGEFKGKPSFKPREGGKPPFKPRGEGKPWDGGKPRGDFKPRSNSGDRPAPARGKRADNGAPKKGPRPGGKPSKAYKAG